MAYCVVADVQRLMGVTFTSTSRPTTADVETIITSVSADLDGILKAAGYSIVPAVDATALLLLKQYAAMGAAVASWHAGFVSDDEPPRVEYWRTQYEAFITRLRNGTQVLPGSVADPTAADVSIADVLTRSDSTLTNQHTEYTG